MNKVEKQNVAEAIRKIAKQAQHDLFSLGSSKTLKKAAHKARMQDFANKAFNKGKK